MWKHKLKYPWRSGWHQWSFGHFARNKHGHCFKEKWGKKAAIRFGRVVWLDVYAGSHADLVSPPQFGARFTQTLSIHTPTRHHFCTATPVRANKEKQHLSSFFFFPPAALLPFSGFVYMVVGRLAVLMEMPAVWLLTPHQVHLLKWQSHLPGRRPLPSSLN